jgi:uncharacterized protein YsxB (DUF464 family)
VVTVTFRRDSRERLSSVFADGDALFDDAGRDIVCAAVSAILQAAWLGLEQHAKVTLDAGKGKRGGKGRLELRWPAESRDRDDVRAIVATAELSIEQIARQYPEHVRFTRVQEV